MRLKLLLSIVVALSILAIPTSAVQQPRRIKPSESFDAYITLGCIMDVTERDALNTLVPSITFDCQNNKMRLAEDLVLYVQHPTGFSIASFDTSFDYLGEITPPSGYDRAFKIRNGTYGLIGTFRVSYNSPSAVGEHSPFKYVLSELDQAAHAAAFDPLFFDSGTYYVPLPAIICAWPPCGFNIKINGHPSITVPATQIAHKGETLTFSIAASDPNANEVLAYSMVSGPTGSTFSSTTRTFSWTPSYTLSYGNYPATFRVTDSPSNPNYTVVVALVPETKSPSYSADGTTQIALVNRPPNPIKVTSFSGGTEIGSYLLSAGVTFRANLSVDDPDRETPSYTSISWNPSPEGVKGREWDLIDQGDGTALFYWTPSDADAATGVFDVDITVSDEVPDYAQTRTTRLRLLFVGCGNQIKEPLEAGIDCGGFCETVCVARADWNDEKSAFCPADRCFIPNPIDGATYKDTTGQSYSGTPGWCVFPGWWDRDWYCESHSATPEEIAELGKKGITIMRNGAFEEWPGAWKALNTSGNKVSPCANKTAEGVQLKVGNNQNGSCILSQVNQSLDPNKNYTLEAWVRRGRTPTLSGANHTKLFFRARFDNDSNGRYDPGEYYYDFSVNVSLDSLKGEDWQKLNITFQPNTTTTNPNNYPFLSLASEVGLEVYVATEQPSGVWVDVASFQLYPEKWNETIKNITGWTTRTKLLALQLLNYSNISSGGANISLYCESAANGVSTMIKNTLNDLFYERAGFEAPGPVGSDIVEGAPAEPIVRGVPDCWEEQLYDPSSGNLIVDEQEKPITKRVCNWENSQCPWGALQPGEPCVQSICTLRQQLGNKEEVVLGAVLNMPPYVPDNETTPAIDEKTYSILNLFDEAKSTVAQWIDWCDGAAASSSAQGGFWGCSGPLSAIDPEKGSSTNIWYNNATASLIYSKEGIRLAKPSLWQAFLELLRSPINSIINWARTKAADKGVGDQWKFIGRTKRFDRLFLNRAHAGGIESWIRAIYESIAGEVFMAAELFNIPVWLCGDEEINRPDGYDVPALGLDDPFRKSLCEMDATVEGLTQRYATRDSERALNLWEELTTRTRLKPVALALSPDEDDIASVSADVSQTNPWSYSFSATLASKPIIFYKWDFGDGTEFATNTAEEALSVQHEYLKNDTYTVTFMTVNRDVELSVESLTVNIAKVALGGTCAKDYQCEDEALCVDGKCTPSQDLIIGAITLNVSTPKVYEPINITVTINNTGDDPAGRSTTRINVSGFTYDLSTEQLQAGASTNVSMSHTFIEAGSYDISASADIFNEVLELNENNNLKTIYFYVGCIDADGDGYNLSAPNCGLADCNDDDSDIKPGATEICGNAVDENCDGAAPPGCWYQDPYPTIRVNPYCSEFCTKLWKNCLDTPGSCPVAYGCTAGVLIGENCSTSCDTNYAFPTTVYCCCSGSP